MVDFTKKIINSNKFRGPAIRFQETGRYCDHPIGTSEFLKHWDEEKRRCLEGYTADDGDYITGYNYFYLNYCPINRQVYKKKKDRFGNEVIKKEQVFEFPDFWDYDYFYFQTIEMAEEQGKHLCVLKSRRKGFSFKGGAMMCRNYYLIPASKSYVYAANKQYLTDDGILTKAWDYMDFIDKHTAWGKKRSVNTAMRKRAGFVTKDEFGNEVEMGYKSEIIGVTLKDNPDIVRGKKSSLILFEEAGSCKELAAAWQIARPSVEIDGIAFAPMIAFGTGGDEDSNFATLKDMFYNPEGYNCLGLPNIWDETPTDKECGFFCPQYTNIDIRDNEGNRLYMDDDGNTLTRKSIDYILSERKKIIENATSSTAVDRYVCERPITPQEAMLEFKGNIFPKKELQEQLALIRTNKTLQNHKQVGDLIWDADGNLHWQVKKTGDITHYPLKKDDDPEGSIVIWEHPNKNASVGLYCAGCDPYDHDQSGTNSLGSCFIYKRIQGIEEYSDIIVAEYTGRPSSAEEFYENVRKLLIYYNARLMYENQNKGLFVYFTNKHCDYLLADQPDIINDVVGGSKVQRKKGCHMNKQIKQWGEGLIKDWLNDTNANGKKNLYNILSEPLLEELISYNDMGNFDRCLRKGTLITTINGDFPIEEIEVGHQVLTHNGMFKPVTWVDSHESSNKKITLKTMGDYQTLTCTDNHPIYVAYSDKKTHKFRKDCLNRKEFLRADKLNYKYQFSLLPIRKHLFDSKINLSDGILYVLGWIMADGYLQQNGYGITITFQKNQLACAEQCKMHIEEYLKDELYYYTGRNRKFQRNETIIKEFSGYYKLEVHSKKLHTLASRFGCNPNDKHISWDIYNRYGNLMPFILGWLEGDGHQKFNANYDGCVRNCIEIATIYEDLIRQCRQIMLDHGIYSSLRRIKSRNNSRTQYSLLISNEYVKKLMSYYCPESSISSYKFKEINVIKNTGKVLWDEEGCWVPIKLLSSEETIEIVYNFEVQDDHTYVANGITTHNCMALMQVMIYREQLYNVVVKEKTKENRNRVLFSGPIFTQQWYNDDQLPSYYDDNVYTF